MPQIRLRNGWNHNSREDGPEHNLHDQVIESSHKPENHPQARELLKSERIAHKGVEVFEMQTELSHGMICTKVMLSSSYTSDGSWEGRGKVGGGRGAI